MSLKKIGKGTTFCNQRLNFRPIWVGNPGPEITTLTSGRNLLGGRSLVGGDGDPFIQLGARTSNGQLKTRLTLGHSTRKGILVIKGSG